MERSSNDLSPRSFRNVAIAVAVAIGVTGFAVSWGANDGQWFSRFGSLIVAWGLVSLLIFQKRFGLLKSSDDEMFDAAIGEAVKAATSSDFEKESTGFRDRLNQYGQSHRQKQAFLTEVSIVTCGTVIWGFGDLLFAKECASC